MNKIIIVLDGGIIQYVLVDDPNKYELIVKDYDVQEDERRDKMPEDSSGEKYYAFSPGLFTMKEGIMRAVREGKKICESL